MMERMTEKHYLGNGYYMKCTESCNGEDIDCIDCAALDKLVDRLGAYEDTGLTPEEIKASLTDGALLKLCAQLLSTNPDRLRELAEADKDGRAAVLPCKVGDTVFVNGTKRTVQATIGEAYLDDVKGIEYLVSFACDADCNGCPFNDWKQDYSGEYSCDGEWGQASISGSDIGKTIFSSREEAEAAMKEMMKDG